jgi:hypothetical protein
MEANKEAFLGIVESGWVELPAICAAAFLLPIIIGQQLVLGTLVNALLIVSALRIKSQYAYVPAFIPSIAAVAAGAVFGMPSQAIAAMVPFIWGGNVALMFIVRRISGFGKALPLAAIAKAALLFLSSFALASFGAFPVSAVQSFGMIQLATALMGGALAYAALNAKR